MLHPAPTALNAPDVVREMLNVAARHPARVAVQTRASRVSYAALAQRTRSFAAAFAVIEAPRVLIARSRGTAALSFAAAGSTHR